MKKKKQTKNRPFENVMNNSKVKTILQDWVDFA